MHTVVFMVDDERTLTDTLTAIIRSRGYDPHGFYDAESALEKSRAIKPDLLITDFNLPGMDGLQLASEITAIHVQCKVIVISGAIARIPDSELAKRFRLLPKPFAPPKLLEEIRSVLDS